MNTSELISLFALIIAIISTLINGVQDWISNRRDKNKMTIIAIRSFESNVYPVANDLNNINDLGYYTKLATELIYKVNVWSVYFNHHLVNRRAVKDNLESEVKGISYKCLPITNRLKNDVPKGYNRLMKYFRIY